MGSAKGGGWATVRLVANWAISVLWIIGGLVQLTSPNSWFSERAAAGILLLAGIALLPPVLRRWRGHLRWDTSPWMPVMFGMIAVAISTATSIMLVPTGKERERLRNEAVSKASADMAQGDTFAADLRLRKFASDRDPVVDRVLAEIKASRGKAAKASPTTPASKSDPIVSQSAPISTQAMQDSASIYAERVRTYWIPEAKALPSNPAADEAAFGALLNKVDLLASYVEDGNNLTLSSTQKAAQRELANALSAKQRVLLPAMRKRYADELRAKLFRRDIDVSASGSANTTIKLTGRLFSLNANIEDFQRMNNGVFKRLRFRQTVYRWSSYFRDGYHYDLASPSDGKVGTWRGSVFQPALNE